MVCPARPPFLSLRSKRITERGEAKPTCQNGAKTHLPKPLAKTTCQNGLGLLPFHLPNQWPHHVFGKWGCVTQIARMVSLKFVFLHGSPQALARPGDMQHDRPRAHAITRQSSGHMISEEDFFQT